MFRMLVRPKLCQRIKLKCYDKVLSVVLPMILR